MTIGMSPTRLNGSDDYCSGLKLQNSLKPPFSEPFKIYNQIAVFMVVIYSTVTLFFNYRVRHEPRLHKVRPFYLSVIHYVAINMLALIINGRGTGWYHMPCIALTCAFFVCIAASTAIVVLRLLILITEANMARRVKLLSENRGIEGLSDDTADTVFTSGVVIHEKDVGFGYFLLGMFGQWSMANKNRVRAAIIRGGGSPPSRISSRARTESGPSISSSPPQRSRKVESSNHLSRKVNTSSLTVKNSFIVESSTSHTNHIQIESQVSNTKTKYFIYVFILMLIPCVIVTVILIGTVDVYKGNCRGCGLYIETFAGINACVILILCVTFPLMYKLKDEVDRFECVHELVVINNVLGMPLLVLGTLLILIDPYELQANNVVFWDWCIMFYMMVLWNVAIVYQTQKALDERNALKGRWLPDMKLSLEDELTRSKFEVFADLNFVSELYRFCYEVESFKKYFYSRSEAERARRCFYIINSFIIVNSPMELNIPDEMRLKFLSLKKNDRGFIDDNDRKLFNVFDQAYNEVIKLLVQGVWGRFLQKHPDVYERLRARFRPELLTPVASSSST